MTLKLLIRTAAFVLTGLATTSTLADCYYRTRGGTYNYEYDISTPLQGIYNSAGKIAGPLNKSAPGSYRGTCDCPVINGPRAASVWLESPLPVYATVGGETYYKINEYLGVAMGTTDLNGRIYYAPARYQDRAEAPPFTCLLSLSHTYETTRAGANMRLKLYVIRPFIGEVIIPRTLVANYFINTTRGGGKPATPLVRMYARGSVSVPQSCEINAGQIITVDFGNIATGNFGTAGSKARGVNPITRNVSVSCKGVEERANLALRLQAGSVSGNAIVSDNKDVGFMLTDSADRPITPNDVNSGIRFLLDGLGKSNVPVRIYPVSVTGNPPAEGRVSSVGYLLADFD
ncbi:fimbrial protein [Shimwellia blattae]|uniref:Fimbrial protein n=1 Tax=Shimwellia blattae (strain ATCC 29907 / DSM 4481 / JCM 1650 / NBRC 105725 / CDC 9005-74) TaxID=630626 RepID=I2B8P3_SHIBC|nr:fimbrial protein [Shimwellia blattae]AFJ46897.1 fimbrial protein [Shimwellia blattae DSM 4481 = NBRC 105725]GAB82442.1 hypothetical protein EB105725_23_00550 [Shimwellia blattae DSM 4481 = NBRC 105725]VDY64383.1 fimbrial-like adhesin [Shimwellia blattae]VEC22499.1 fimbrial-like adhesin [Shimwellia blattae]